MRKFIRDPKNLRYSLNTIIPVIVFLTSVLAAVVVSAGRNFSVGDYIWMLVVSIFSSVCSFMAVLAITQPLKDLVRTAEKTMKLDEMRKDGGSMVEVYQLIERLMMLAGSKGVADAKEKHDIMEDIQKLDYIVPLGYMSLTVAHEVRNPLSTITGMSELLKANMEGRKAIEYVDTILDAARKIDVFTKDLLDFSDDMLIEEQFDIIPVIMETLRDLSERFKDVQYEVNTEPEVVVMGDKDKIYQAIFNIVKNAFEYERNGGYVKIEVRSGGAVAVSVYNKGSRIEKEDIESIFKPFFSKRRGGRGIGLFIAMRNIRLHGGNIEVETGNAGTTFIIRLPQKQAKTGEK